MMSVWVYRYGDVFCMYMCRVVAREIVCTMEPHIQDTHEIRTPHKQDTFGCRKNPVCVCTLQPLKSRHLTHKDAFFCLKGVRIREIPMCVFVHHS